METTIVTAKAIAATVAGGAVGVAIDLNSYLPYLLGGIALLGYMVTHNEIQLRSMSSVYVIFGAMLMGYMTIPIIEPIINILFNSLVNKWLTPEQVLASKTLTDGNIEQGGVRIVSVALSGLSRTIFLKFFTSREKIVNTVIRSNENDTNDNR